MSRRSARPAAILSAALLALVLAAGAASAKAPGPQKPISYNLYFGDLHAHTSFSDGARGSTPADAFAAGKAAGADFMALTDHQGSLTPEEWVDTQAAAASATSDTFVALPAYEFWVTGVGEINVFGAEGWPKYPVGNGASKADAGHHQNRQLTLPDTYDWLAAQRAAAGQWNHPTGYAGVSSENFVGYEGLTPARDAAMGLIEVYNDIVYEPSYVMALDAGWHVMPAANSDTHAADWISGSDARTVLLASDLSPDALIAAMRAGRGYATVDRNLRVRFTINGAVMGSILDGSTSTFSVSVEAEDPDTDAADAITQVEIVSDNGTVVASQPGIGGSITWKVTLTSGSARYYYARISTASGPDGVPGPTAWTAPVWTGR